MRAVLTPSAVVALALLAAGCGDDADDAASDRAQIVVSTSILGDVVRGVVGDLADVEVVMPEGADPHEFAPSARQAEAMVDADLLVVNGAGFEQGLQGQIEQAEAAGTAVFAAADHVELLELDEHDDEHDDEHGDVDPHIWMDPSRMAGVVEALGEQLATVVADADAVRTRAAASADELRALDAELESLLDIVPAERRVLVTNHEVLGYFADRYDFEVVGAVIPSLTTGAQASAADLEALAEVIEREGVPAIFAETTSSSALADALADQVGDMAVVSLHTESLGPASSGADTYVGLLRTDVELIVDALT
jgi:zinc/manganese transport system substrate-binding protein